MVAIIRPTDASSNVRIEVRDPKPLLSARVPIPQQERELIAELILQRIAELEDQKRVWVVVWNRALTEWSQLENAEPNAEMDTAPVQAAFKEENADRCDEAVEKRIETEQAVCWAAALTTQPSLLPTN